MSKTLKYIIAIAAILLLLYFSVDIQNLDEYKSSYKLEDFDAEAYANTVWENNIPLIAQ